MIQYDRGNVLVDVEIGICLSNIDRDIPSHLIGGVIFNKCAHADSLQSHNSESLVK